MSTDYPPCHGKSALFDSTDASDHIEAARLCADCTIRAACEADTPPRQEFPEGTWAGRLLIDGRPVASPVVRTCGVCSGELTNTTGGRKYHPRCAGVAHAARQKRLRDAKKEEAA